MARTNSKKKTSRASTEARTRKSKTPVQTEIPGAERPRIKALEDLGRELGDITSDIALRKGEEKAARERIDRALAKSELATYRLDDGRLLTRTMKSQIRIKRAPKRGGKRRKNAAERAEDRS